MRVLSDGGGGEFEFREVVVEVEVSGGRDGTRAGGESGGGGGKAAGGEGVESGGVGVWVGIGVHGLEGIWGLGLGF